MSYRIGSFNVRNMSQNADSEKIEAIAKIIKSENHRFLSPYRVQGWACIHFKTWDSVQTWWENYQIFDFCYG